MVFGFGSRRASRPRSWSDTASRHDPYTRSSGHRYQASETEEEFRHRQAAQADEREYQRGGSSRTGRRESRRLRKRPINRYTTGKRTGLFSYTWRSEYSYSDDGDGQSRHRSNGGEDWFGGTSAWWTAGAAAALTVYSLSWQSGRGPGAPWTTLAAVGSAAAAGWSLGKTEGYDTGAREALELDQKKAAHWRKKMGL